MPQLAQVAYFTGKRPFPILLIYIYTYIYIYNYIYIYIYIIYIYIYIIYIRYINTTFTLNPIISFYSLHIVPLGSPINCTNTTFLPRTVTLVWTEPEGAFKNEEIPGYYLQCRIDGSESQIPDVNDTQDIPDTNYTIPVLLPFTSYRCLLAAINQFEQGPPTMCVFTIAQDSKYKSDMIFIM